MADIIRNNPFIQAGARSLQELVGNASQEQLQTILTFTRQKALTRSNNVVVPPNTLGEGRLEIIADTIIRQGWLGELAGMLSFRTVKESAPSSFNVNAVVSTFGTYRVDVGQVSSRVTEYGNKYIPETSIAHDNNEDIEAFEVGRDSTYHFVVDERDLDEQFPRPEARSFSTLNGIAGDCTKIVDTYVKAPMRTLMAIREISMLTQAKNSDGETTLETASVVKVNKELGYLYADSAGSTSTTNMKEIQRVAEYAPNGTKAGPEFASDFLNHVAKSTKIDMDMLTAGLEDVVAKVMRTDTELVKQFRVERKVDGKVHWKASAANDVATGGYRRVGCAPFFAMIKQLATVPTAETANLTLQALMDVRGGNDSALAQWAKVSVDGIPVVGVLRKAHDFLQTLATINFSKERIYVLAVSDSNHIELLRSNYPGISFIVIGNQTSTVAMTRKVLTDGGVIFAKNTAHPGNYPGVDRDRFVFLDLFAPMNKISSSDHATASGHMRSQFIVRYKELASQWHTFVTRQHFMFMPTHFKFAPCPESIQGFLLASNRSGLNEPIVCDLEYTTALSYCIYQAHFQTAYRQHMYLWDGSIPILKASFKSREPANKNDLRAGTKLVDINFRPYSPKFYRLSLPDVQSLLDSGINLDSLDHLFTQFLPPEEMAALVEGAARNTQLQSQQKTVPSRDTDSLDTLLASLAPDPNEALKFLQETTAQADADTVLAQLQDQFAPPNTDDLMQDFQ